MEINKKYRFIIVLFLFALLQIGLFNTIISFAEDKEIGKENLQQAIPDGIYAIKTVIDEKYALNVEGASKDNSANVLLYKYSKQNHEKFQVKYVGEGYYTIRAVHSGKSLDVYAGGKSNGTNVQQYKINNADTQKWKIIENTDGSYSVISKCNGLYLDATAGIARNGTNIAMYEGHGGNAQKFKFVDIEQTIEEGTYAIKTVIDKEYSLNVEGKSKENSANVLLYKYSGQNHEKFKVEYLGGGYYNIIAIHSGKSLDVHAGGKNNGTNVQQYKINNADTQKWKIIENIDGSYSIMSKCNGLYIDVTEGKAQNGANIQMYEGHEGNSQKFILELVSTDSDNNNDNNDNEIVGSQIIKDGIYSIETAVSSNYVLDIEGGSRENCANLQIYKKQSANRQKFQVTYLGDGYYSIIAKFSDKVLDVEYSGMKNGTNVIQYEINQPITKNQKWIIKEAGNGYFYIISVLNGLYLDLYAGNAQSGNNIQLYTGHGGNSQKFKFVEPINILNSINTNKYPGYKEKIATLMELHPGWNFELLYTGLNFNQVVAGECELHSRNLVPTNYGGEWICSICGTKLYDSGWYCASEKAVAYYMDPRNFLDETNVFQFQDLNEYINSVCTLQGIQAKVQGTFLENYANAIDNACKSQNVNSYYIIARVLQEQGASGTTIGKGMDGGDGKIYYNPFNIGASGNGWSEIYANALVTAKNNGWDTMQKALEGGITFCKRNWLENYQNTLYQNKFDIDTRNGTSLYTHQYMQNLMAAYSEAKTMRSMYVNTGKLESNFTFIIPMYENISTTLSQEPVNNSETSPINVKVTAQGGLNIRQEANTGSAVLRTIETGEVILSVQRGINSNWHKVITTDGLIGYMSGTYLKLVDDVINCNYTAKVKTADGIGCKIRVGPSINLEQITALSDGIIVIIINEGTYNNIDGYNWSRIQLSDGRQAFMPSRYLEKQ